MNSESKILVAVAMWTYNHEKYISQAIESVLMQKSSFRYKIILGEDYSTDKTREICEYYKNTYPDKIELLLNDKNLGAQQNSINVLKKCVESDAQYIALLDGDDYWIDPLKLQKQVDILETNPDYAMVYTNYIESNQQFNKYRKCKLYNRADYQSLLEKKNFIATLTTCIKKEILLKYFDEINPLNKNWPVGDYPMWLYISLQGKIKHLSIFASVYRKHNVSACHFVDIDRQFTFYKKVINIADYYVLKYGCPKKSLKYIIKNKINIELDYAFAKREKNKFKEYLLIKFKSLHFFTFYDLIKLFILQTNCCFLLKKR